MEPLLLAPDAFTAFMRAEYEKYAAVVTATGVTVE
jgi:hypothetical protein